MGCWTHFRIYNIIFALGFPRASVVIPAVLSRWIKLVRGQVSQLKQLLMGKGVMAAKNIHINILHGRKIGIVTKLIIITEFE